MLSSLAPYIFGIKLMVARALGLAFCLSLMFFKLHALNPAEDMQANKHIYGTNQIEAIKGWGGGVGGVSINAISSGEEIGGIRGLKGVGETFTRFNKKLATGIFLTILLGVPLIFFLHLKLIGAKKFKESAQVKVFSKFNIFIHWVVALPFMLLCITGLIMSFGSAFNAFGIVRLARDVHALSTCLFVIFAPIMFFMWIKPSLPKAYDLKWLLNMGGYLSKKKSVVMAGKFNAGQKLWFFIAMFGGLFMSVTGGLMYFMYGDINLLRLASMLHIIVGWLIVAMLFTHIYMSLFAIEGALESMLSGSMGEEEIYMLHHHYYLELEKLGKVGRLK